MKRGSWSFVPLALGVTLVAACNSGGDDAPGTNGRGADNSGTGSGSSPEGSGNPGGNGPPVVPSGTCTDLDEAKLAVGGVVDVPAGAFEMGCADGDALCNEDEKPKRSVTLAAFSIDVHEVTRAQYLACVEAGNCGEPTCEFDPCQKPDHPVVCVTRQQAIDYCNWAGKRLPTEAEWEKAARGADGRVFPWGNDAPDCNRANIKGCGDAVAAVGGREAGASPYGAKDMSGNVVEWTTDYYDEAYYASGPAENPAGPQAGTDFSGRGGGFLSPIEWARAGTRDSYPADFARRSMGFRCAK